MTEVKKNNSTIAQFTYDGDGTRVKSVIGSETILVVGGHYEKQGSNITKYYLAGAQRIAVRKNGTLSYLLGDHLGSTSITTDANGNRVSEMRYKAWGEVRFTEGPLPTKYTFTGQYSNLDDFGLMYYGARWLDNTTGRFVQADTIVPPGVQGYDRYAYVNNKPINNIDPSGHRCVGLAEECKNDEGSMSAGMAGGTRTPAKGSGCGHTSPQTCSGDPRFTISPRLPTPLTPTIPMPQTIVLHLLDGNGVSQVPIYDYSDGQPRLIGWRNTIYAIDRDSYHTDFSALNPFKLDPLSLTNNLLTIGEYLIKEPLETLAGVGVVVVCAECAIIVGGVQWLSNINTFNQFLSFDAHLFTYDVMISPPNPLESFLFQPSP